jgi:class 3 adenylate cyclase/tRNA A-37 threonylcarbamoyl transferase component Bud32
MTNDMHDPNRTEPQANDASDASIAETLATSAGVVESRLMVLMFTDLVDSSAAKIKLGDVDYANEIAKPHNTMFRAILTQFPGAQENNYTGDGFLAMFARVSDAVNAALLFQQALASYAWKNTPAPQVRIGIHVGETMELEGKDADQLLIASHAADMTARIMSLGMGNQTLLSLHAFDDGRQYVRSHPRFGAGDEVDANHASDTPELKWIAHGKYLFKGKDEPLEVFEVGAEGLAPFKAPPDAPKARRAVSAEEEATLGWRPAVGLEIPSRKYWMLKRKIGEGGFGEVWLASNSKTRDERVFKFCFDVDRLRSFKRELTLFRLIREALGERDDIAKLIDVQFDKPPFYLESDHVESGNLSQWAVSKGGIDEIPLATRLGIVERIAHAVAAAHSLGIIHKDIKPSNIFIQEKADGSVQPMIADFGIGAVADQSLLAQHDITIAGFTETLVGGNHSSRTGTRLYAPPESQVGKPATTTGDVYALGVLLYQMVLGDLDRPLGSGWQRDVADDLLRNDIAACTDVDLTRRIKSVGEIEQSLATLESRRSKQRRERRRCETRDNHRLQ